MNESLSPDRPVAGFYKWRLVRGGPWVVVEIWRGFPRDPVTGETIEHGAFTWRASENGRQVDVFKVWPGCAMHPIDRKEAERLTAKKADPEAPENYPRDKVDLGRMKPLF